MRTPQHPTLAKVHLVLTDLPIVFNAAKKALRSFQGLLWAIAGVAMLALYLLFRAR